MKLRLRLTEDQYTQVENFLLAGKKTFGITGCGSDPKGQEYSYSLRELFHTELDDGFQEGKIYFRIASGKSEIYNQLDIIAQNECQLETFMVCYIISNSLLAFCIKKGIIYPFDLIAVVGNKIKFYFNDQAIHYEEMNLRTEQMFGKATVSILQKLKVGVIGVSGTGSIVAEQLVRLGIGEIVLVDNDVVEEKNLNRILNSKKRDALSEIFKVEMFEQYIKIAELPTKVITRNTVVANYETIKELSQCDVLFGCLDSIDGRHHLNIISTCYIIPYFDVGVKLVADGSGGVDEITTAAHYIQPGKSSLMSRHVYNSEMLSAASLKRENPEEYAKRLQEKYIVGAQETSPAVISVNMLAASIVVLDFLARVHQYRNEDMNSIETIRMDLTNLRVILDISSDNCSIFSRFLGQGDENHLLISVN